MKKSTLILVPVFLALLVGALVLINKKPERGIARLDASVAKDAIDRVTVGGKSPVELKKDGETWRLASGRAADEGAINRMLDGIAKLKSSDLVPADDAKLKDFELDDEKGAVLTVWGKGKKLSELTLGRANGGALMVKKDRDVYRVPGITQAAFIKAESAWIDRKLFSEKIDDVTRTTIKLAGAAPYSLVKKDNAWALEDASVLPAGFRFDVDAARGLVNALVSARVKEFEAAVLAPDVTGLGEGADELTFEAKAGEAAPVTRTLRLGKVKEGQKEIYGTLAGGNDVFTVPEHTAKSLKKAVTDLRDMKLMAFDKAQAKKLAILDGKVNLSFEKKDGAWALVRSSEPTPKDFTFDPAQVERRVMALANTKAAKLTDASKAAAGLTAPSAKVTVTLEDGKSATLAFGKETKDEDREVTYASGNADDVVYFAPKHSRQNLLGGIATFKKQEAPPGMGGMGGLDPAALSSLPPEVRESFMKQMREQAQQQEMLKRLQQQKPQ